MKSSEKKWKWSYIEANSECSYDRYMLKMKHELEEHRRLAQISYGSAQFYREMNTKLQQTIEEMANHTHELVATLRLQQQQYVKGNSNPIYQLKLCIQNMDSILKTEKNRYDMLHSTNLQLMKELEACRHVIQSRYQILYMYGLSPSKDNVSDKVIMMEQQMTQLQMEINKLEKYKDYQINQYKIRHLYQIEEILEEKRQVKKYLEDLKRSAHFLPKKFQKIDIDSLSRLAVYQSKQEDTNKKTEIGAKEEAEMLKNELAAAKIKIYRLESALYASDRRIALLERQKTTKPCTTYTKNISYSRAAISTKPKINIKSPVPKPKRTDEPSSYALRQSSPYIVPCFYNDRNSMRELTRVNSHYLQPPLYYSADVNYNNGNIPNITMLESVQLRHSDSEANMKDTARFQISKPSNNSTFNSQTDRDSRKKIGLQHVKIDNKWINLMR